MIGGHSLNVVAMVESFGGRLGILAGRHGLIRMEVELQSL